MTTNTPTPDILTSLSCPIPISDYPTVLMAHGGGGSLTQMLIERMFLQAFDNPTLELMHDGAVINLPPAMSEENQGEGTRLAFSTSSS